MKVVPPPRVRRGWCRDVDADGREQLPQRLIGTVAGHIMAHVLGEVPRVSPILAHDHQIGVQVTLPQAPVPDVVGVVDSAVAAGRVDESGAGMAVLAGADKGT
jgi:hypothetical protein